MTTTSRTKIAELLGWHSTKSGDEHTSLTDHVDRMKGGQNDIYDFTGKSITAVSSSPFLETLRKKGLEAMYTVDPVDEHHVHQLREFDGMKLKSTTKEGLDLNDEDEKKRLEMKEVLGDKVDKVLVSSRMALYGLLSHGVLVKGSSMSMGARYGSAGPFLVKPPGRGAAPHSQSHYEQPSMMSTCSGNTCVCYCCRCLKHIRQSVYLQVLQVGGLAGHLQGHPGHGR